MKTTRALIQRTGGLAAESDYTSLRKPPLRWVSKGFALHASPQESRQKNKQKVGQGGEQNAAQTLAPTPAKNIIGFAVIASKKTAKLAVDRNRMRRRLRAVSWEILPQYADPSYDYMVIARRDLPLHDYETLRRDFIWCLKKLGLFKSHKPQETPQEQPQKTPAEPPA